jgi:anthranilate synthase/aminodeoxychorismate synthase-like glutamine amidotransferase
MILLIDNYDSFTFNLYQLMTSLEADVVVVRNDQVDVEAIAAMDPDAIVISPGPGTPSTAGISKEVIRTFASDKAIFGVCLGHQCIAEAYGGLITSAPELMHGKSSPVYHAGQGVFEGLDSPIDAIRYHSLTLEPSTVPECVEVTARTANGTIMGLRHREYDVEGVQFHPESVMTPEGPRLMANWLRRVGERTRGDAEPAKDGEDQDSSRPTMA